MQQLKQKIKPPFLLDGVQIANKGKLLDYKAEKDSHLEQYFYNIHMRQQMNKMKKDQQIQINLLQQQQSSSELIKHGQQLNQLQNQSSSPKHLTNSKVSNNKNPSKVSRSLSKEHLVTFLDSLINTVQNVQQLVITYFPPDKITNQLAKQQDELNKISQTAEYLSRQLYENSFDNKQQTENVKTQKNISKLPQLRIFDINEKVTKTERGRNYNFNISNPNTSKIINSSKTLDKRNNLELNQTDSHNFEFQQYIEQIQENKTNTTNLNKPNNQTQIQRNPDSLQQNKQNINTNKIIYLPSLKITQKKPNFQNKKYQKEIQLDLATPTQHKNINNIRQNHHSPQNFQSKIIAIKENQFQNLSNNQKKHNQKQITSNNKSIIEQQQFQENIIIQRDSKKKLSLPQIAIKITNIDKNVNLEPPMNGVQIEVPQNITYNISNDSGLKDQDTTQIQDEEKSKFASTAYFNILEDIEEKGPIGKMIESNEINRLNFDNTNSKNQLNNEPEYLDNTFIKMIQNQANENDLKLLKQQQTNYNTLNENDVRDFSQILIKAVESIDAFSDNDIVNPLEDQDDDQRENEGRLLMSTLEKCNQYQKEHLQQEQ